MFTFHLYPILDEDLIRHRGLDADSLLKLWAGQNIRFFQYRAKGLSSRERLDRLSSIMERAQIYGLRCIVNDDFGLFLNGMGDGFHLGFEDSNQLSPGERMLIRSILKDRVFPLRENRGSLTGISTHTPEQFAEALSLHRTGEFLLSCIAFGPCYPTDSKKGGLHPRVTLAGIADIILQISEARRADSSAPDPVLIGGIDPVRARSLARDLGAELAARGFQGDPLKLFLASISAAADAEQLHSFSAMQSEMS